MSNFMYGFDDDYAQARICAEKFGSEVFVNGNASLEDENGYPLNCYAVEIAPERLLSERPTEYVMERAPLVLGEALWRTIRHNSKDEDAAYKIAADMLKHIASLMIQADWMRTLLREERVKLGEIKFTTLP